MYQTLIVFATQSAIAFFNASSTCLSWCQIHDDRCWLESVGLIHQGTAFVDCGKGQCRQWGIWKNRMLHWGPQAQPDDTRREHHDCQVFHKHNYVCVLYQENSLTKSRLENVLLQQTYFSCLIPWCTPVLTMSLSLLSFMFEQLLSGVWG